MVDCDCGDCGDFGGDRDCDSCTCDCCGDDGCCDCDDGGCEGNDGGHCYAPGCWYYNGFCCEDHIIERSRTNYESKEVDYSGYGLQDIATLTVDQILVNIHRELTTHIALRDAVILGIDSHPTYQAQNIQNGNTVDDFANSQNTTVISEKKKIQSEEKEKEIHAHADDQIKIVDIQPVDDQKAQDKNVHHIVNMQPRADNKPNSDYLLTVPPSYTTPNSTSAELNLKLLGERWAKLRKTFMAKAITLTPEQRQTEEIALRAEIENIQEQLERNAVYMLVKKSHKRKSKRASVMRLMAVLVFIVVITVIIATVKK